MPELKGPAIDSEVFRVEGHCCGIRIPALLEPDSDGLRFELSPEKNEVPEPGQLSSLFASSSEGTLPLSFTTPSTTSAGVNITPKSG